MISKILALAAVITISLGLVKMYGDTRYNEGIADQLQATEKAASAKRAEDAKVTIPNIRRDADARKVETAEALAKAAAELPRDSCFNMLIDTDSAARVRPQPGGPAPVSGPTPN